ncbi:MAG: transcriptional regulator, partial [Peptostreptococcus sp.]|nr:transcriptional regulator [Peptostreptococcus sp.]
NIHNLLDDKLKAIQLAMEAEMKKYTIEDLSGGMKELLAKEI